MVLLFAWSSVGPVIDTNVKSSAGRNLWMAMSEDAEQRRPSEHKDRRKRPLSDAT